MFYKIFFHYTILYEKNQVNIGVVKAKTIIKNGILTSLYILNNFIMKKGHKWLHL